MPVGRPERYSGGVGGGGCRCKIRDDKGRIERKWDREGVLGGPRVSESYISAFRTPLSPFYEKNASGPSTTQYRPVLDDTTRIDNMTRMYTGV